MIRSLLMSCLALFSFANTAWAVPGECNDVQCIIFEVTIHLNSYHETPLTRRTSHMISLDGTSSHYDSVVERAGDSCTKQVRVPRSVYEMVTDVMASIGGTSGQPLPVLTPSQQTILLLYTTLSQQTMSFTCSPRDLGEGDSGGSVGGGIGGSYSSPVEYSARFSGVMNMGSGNLALVEENGVSRTVRQGDYLIGGWRIVEIRSHEMIIQRGTDRAMVPVGGNY